MRHAPPHLVGQERGKAHTTAQAEQRPPNVKINNIYFYMIINELSIDSARHSIKNGGRLFSCVFCFAFLFHVDGYVKHQISLFHTLA